MKIRNIVLAAAFTLTAAAASAQEEGGYVFKKHAFINLQGGAQYTLGEAKFKDLISPNVQLGVGYQFNPWFAARIQANGWQSKGGYNGVTETGNPAPHNVTYAYKYVAPGLDFMFNLSNAFCGYNPERVFNVTAFLGGGANVAFDNDEANSLGKDYNMRYLWDGTKVNPFGRAGLELAFRISDAVRFVVEGNANILSDKYNSKKAENPDWYFNALAGLRINLGKTYEKVEPVAEPEPAPAPAPAPVVKPEPAPVVETPAKEPLRRDIFFTINSSKVSADEQKKVQDVVDYLNKYPEAKVAVTGYADAGTGNNTINDRLAKQRANVVLKALTTQFGISSDRIVVDSKGSRVQPFAENDKNRVSICIAE